MKSNVTRLFGAVAVGALASMQVTMAQPKLNANNIDEVINAMTL